MESEISEQPSKEVLHEQDPGKQCADPGNISLSDINQIVADHQAKTPGMRYVYIDLDILENPEEANLARVGLFKALNSVSIATKDIYVGEQVDEAGVVYAIDPEKLWPGKSDQAWNTIAAGRGQNTGIPGASRQMEEPFDGSKPQPASRVAYNAMVPSVYLTLTETQATEAGERQKNRVQDPVVAWSAIKEAIVFGPRLIHVRKMADGRNYWATCDEFIGQEGKDITASRNATPRLNGVKCGTVSAIQAHEVWFDSPKGLPIYRVYGAVSQSRGKAERLFVVDPGNPVRSATTQGMTGGELLTGRSCVTCHIQGVQQIKNDYSGQGNWSTDAELAELYNESRGRYQEAMRKIVEGVSCNTDESWRKKVASGSNKIEPVNYLILRIEK